MNSVEIALTVVLTFTTILFYPYLRELIYIKPKRRK
jgi:hypothetical protein